MNTYPKIQSIYKRDLKTNYKTFLEGEFSRPEFKYLFYSLWSCFEKVDGTNIRIQWTTHPLIPEHHQPLVKGRTDKAQIPPFLLLKLAEIFTWEKMNSVFPIADNEDEAINICLYGEGYGARINKGGVYIPDGVDFILFDIKIGDMWLKREDVVDIAEKLEIKVVPELGIVDLKTAIEMVKTGIKSELRADGGLAEGLVCKPFIELRDRRGRRIITKIKHRDYGVKEEK